MSKNYFDIRFEEILNGWLVRWGDKTIYCATMDSAIELATRRLRFWESTRSRKRQIHGKEQSSKEEKQEEIPQEEPASS